MHGIDEGELEIEPFRLLRQFSTLLERAFYKDISVCVFDEGLNEF